MTRENNKTSNKTTVWSYDELGNISAKTEYAYTTGTPSTATKTITYGYGKDSKSGWNNLLVSVDKNGNGTTDIGESISYDEIGNPTTYLGAELKWNGRQLTSYTTDDKAITYTYDANGLRASKIQKDYTTTDGVKALSKTTETKYYYVNGQLHYQDTLTTKADGTTVATKLHFYYDSYGYLTGIKYNGTNYYVATNKRGDVVALYYYDGRIMGRYEYDAWGNVIKIEDISYDSAGNQVIADLTNNTTSRDLLVVNPIRYRGYYYDVETELYYLQSRYYNAQVGSFLNADGYLTTDADNPLAYNMFAYCMNNPVMFSDPSGKWTMLAALGFILTVSSIICASIDIADSLKPVSKTVRVLTNTLDAISNGASLYNTLATAKDGFDTAAATKIAHTANVVNAGSSKYSGNSTQVTIPNKKVFSNEVAYQNLCETSYSSLISKTTLELDRDIQGLSWNELTFDEQEKLVNTMGAWDIETAENIAYECTEKVVGGIFF